MTCIVYNGDYGSSYLREWNRFTLFIVQAFIHYFFPTTLLSSLVDLLTYKYMHNVLLHSLAGRTSSVVCLQVYTLGSKYRYTYNVQGVSWVLTLNNHYFENYINVLEILFLHKLKSLQNNIFLKLFSCFTYWYTFLFRISKQRI